MVILWCQWVEPSVTACEVEKNPVLAWRRLYVISQQPDCVDMVNELWRQAWPQAVWSDLLSDDLSHVWPVQLAAHNDASHHGEHTGLSISVEVQISSDEPLQLPWDWLANTLLFAPAAGLWFHPNATAPQQLQKDLPGRFDSRLEDGGRHIYRCKPAQACTS